MCADCFAKECSVSMSVCCVVTANALPTAEPVAEQSPPPAPTNSDPSHARGGHGIFGEPMVSCLMYLLVGL